MQRYWKNVDFILESPKFAAAFIAGFWDADGDVFHEPNGAFRARLYNSNLSLLKKIANAMAKHFRIEVRLYKRKTVTLPQDSIRARSVRYDLYVKAGANSLWAKYIGRHMRLPWKKP